MKMLLLRVRNFLCSMAVTNVELRYQNIINKRHCFDPMGNIVYGSQHAPYSRNNDLENIAALVRDIKKEN